LVGVAEGGEADVVECAVGDDQQALAGKLAGDGAEQELAEGVGGGLGAFWVAAAGGGAVEALNRLGEFGAAGEDMDLQAVGGDGPEVAALVAEGVLQQQGVGVEDLLLDLWGAEGLGILQGGVGGAWRRGFRFRVGAVVAGVG